MPFCNCLSGVWLLTRLLQLGGSILALLALSQSATAAPVQVDLKLVLATDVSRSMNTEEFQIEREGTAEAFLDREVIKAIQSGSLGRIAVALFDFSSPEDDRLVINWQIIHDAATAAAFANAVRIAPRSLGRRTSVSGALEFGSVLLSGSDKDIVATRKVIDVSGDGPNNDGNPMTQVHDLVIGERIVVNGLPVMDDNANGYYPDLDKYYAGCVIGGPGAFVIVVRRYADYSAAMRHKLILEISQNENQIRQAANDLRSKRFLMSVAATPGRAPNAPPQVLRPANNYPGGCDIQGGFGGFGRRRF
jgi:uncharacterized protein DUF1194